jgi:hypothetical protein
MFRTYHEHSQVQKLEKTLPKACAILVAASLSRMSSSISNPVGEAAAITLGWTGMGSFLYKRPSLGAQVAQLVEQRTENPCVGGSIPPLGTSNFKRLDREHLAKCLTCPMLDTFLVHPAFASVPLPFRLLAKSSLAIATLARFFVGLLAVVLDHRLGLVAGDRHDGLGVATGLGEHCCRGCPQPVKGQAGCHPPGGAQFADQFEKPGAKPRPGKLAAAGADDDDRAAARRLVQELAQHPVRRHPGRRAGLGGAGLNITVDIVRPWKRSTSNSRMPVRTASAIASRNSKGAASSAVANSSRVQRRLAFGALRGR